VTISWTLLKGHLLTMHFDHANMNFEEVLMIGVFPSCISQPTLSPGLKIGISTNGLAL